MPVKRLATYTHLSSTVSEIQQVIGRKLRHFHTLPLFSAPAGGDRRRNFAKILYTHKIRMNGLSCDEESMTICSAVLIQYQRVTERTDGRTIGQTKSLYLRRASTWLTYVKMPQNLIPKRQEPPKQPPILQTASAPTTREKRKTGREIKYLFWSGHTDVRSNNRHIRSVESCAEVWNLDLYSEAEMLRR